MSLEESQGTHWTGRQSITGLVTMVSKASVYFIISCVSDRICDAGHRDNFNFFFIICREKTCDT